MQSCLGLLLFIKNQQSLPQEFQSRFNNSADVLASSAGLGESQGFGSQNEANDLVSTFHAEIIRSWNTGLKPIN
jgi:hypothetical protein